MRKQYAKHVSALTISRPCFCSQNFRAFSVCSPSKYLVAGVLHVGRKAELIFNILKWGGSNKRLACDRLGLTREFRGRGCATAVLAAVAVRRRSIKKHSMNK